MRYFDTGLLLKLYLPEPRAAEAITLVNASPNPPPFTDLHGLEMRSALRQKVGRGEITQSDCRQLLAAVEVDIQGGVYQIPRLIWAEVFAQAETLSAAHGVATLCRSLDTLHVALAFELGCEEFCSFDNRQARMAVAAGLTVIPWRSPTNE